MLRQDDKSMTTALLLVIGAADTARAPMAAALLRRALVRRGMPWAVESAGVVGHDGDPAEAEARDALLTLGLDLSGHTARSLTPELAEQATLLVAVDAGVARVLQAHYPEARTVTLGALAGRQRDIPDPFRMQFGAWLHYTTEIDTLIQAGLPRLMVMIEGIVAGTGDNAQGSGGTEGQRDRGTEAEREADAADPEAQAAREAAVERLGRLLGFAAEMPEAVNWGGAARQVEADFAAMERPIASGDKSDFYVPMLRDMVATAGATPTPGQLTLLRGAVLRLRAPIGKQDLEALMAESVNFASA
jgi:protein-tyrosine phosphatase